MNDDLGRIDGYERRTRSAPPEHVDRLIRVALALANALLEMDDRKCELLEEHLTRAAAEYYRVEIER